MRPSSKLTSNVNPGDMFGQITYLGEGPRKLFNKKNPQMLRTAHVRCICGKEYDLILNRLEKTKSCGCSIKKYDKLDQEKVVELYKDKNNTRKIAKIFNVSQPTIIRILRSNGIVLKTRKYDMDETYFEKIDTEEKAYWLGFLAADGCVMVYKQKYDKNGKSKNPGNCINLKLSVADEAHLLKFRKAISPDALLQYATSTVRTRKGTISTSNNVKVSLYSNQMVDHIIDKGVGPKKTFTVGKPNIDPKWYNHFIRGLFDGDGCVTIGKVHKNIRYKITTASDDMVDFLYQVAKSLDIKMNRYGIQCVVAITEDCVKFYDYMYKDATVWLERKRDKVQEGLEWHYQKLEDIKNFGRTFNKNNIRTNKEVIKKIIEYYNKGYTPTDILNCMEGYTRNSIERILYELKKDKIIEKRTIKIVDKLQYQEAIKLLKEGKQIKETANLSGVSKNTVLKLKHIVIGRDRKHIMKSNQEIMDYLKPYTEMKGNVYKTLVEVIPNVNNQMYVFIDIKSSWVGIGGTDTRHYSIKKHLKNNGFLYDESMGCYFRSLYKKYWNKV